MPGSAIREHLATVIGTQVAVWDNIFSLSTQKPVSGKDYLHCSLWVIEVVKGREEGFRTPSSPERVADHTEPDHTPASGLSGDGGGGLHTIVSWWTMHYSCPLSPCLDTQRMQEQTFFFFFFFGHHFNPTAGISLRSSGYFFRFSLYQFLKSGVIDIFMSLIGMLGQSLLVFSGMISRLINVGRRGSSEYMATLLSKVFICRCHTDTLFFRREPSQ